MLNSEQVFKRPRKGAAHRDIVIPPELLASRVKRSTVRLLVNGEPWNASAFTERDFITPKT